MTTITAMDLRNHLEEIVSRVRGGESIRVTYRSKPAFLLQPDTVDFDVPEPGSVVAMQSFVKKVREIDKIPRQSSLDPNKSTKQLYQEMLDSDPKYQGHYE